MNVPEFRSDIPKHLLKGANPRERYVTETLSKLDQAVKWQSDQLVRLDENHQDTQGKLKRFKDYAQPILAKQDLQEEKEKMSKARMLLILGGVSVISSFCGACASLLSPLLNP